MVYWYAFKMYKLLINYKKTEKNENCKIIIDNYVRIVLHHNISII